MPFIFSAEIESIQKYIVTSNKMWTIRAGSYILDNFNRGIKDEFKNKNIPGGKLIYSSAGSVKAIFYDNISAERYGKRIAKRLKDLTDIASLTWAIEEIRNNNIPEALKEALKDVEKRIQEKRSRKETPVSIVNHPLFYDIVKSVKITQLLQKSKK